MEEPPKREELNMDCLVNILARVGFESLLLDVPYVRKSWYKAACIPQCWRIIDSTKRLLQHYGLRIGVAYYMTPYDKTATTNFIKYVVKRGNEFTTSVRFPITCTLEVLIFLLNQCPNLKTLKLPRVMEGDIITQFPYLVSKWTRLESVSLTWSSNFEEIFEQISTHCSNFRTLEINYCLVERNAASSIVTYLPNLKRLGLSHSEIEKENVLTILNGLKKLENLDARYCVGFNWDDKDILEFSSSNCSLELECSFEEDMDDPYHYETCSVEDFNEEQGKVDLDDLYYQGYYW